MTASSPQTAGPDATERAGLAAPDDAGQGGHASQADAVMMASRLLVAISAQSLAEVENDVTLTQWRVLAIVASRGPVNLASLAAALGVHPSNATRASNRLVGDGLLLRREDPGDRRQLILELSEQGRALVNRVATARRAAIAQVLDRMDEEQRARLVPALLDFAAAGGELPPVDLWAFGWTS